MEDNVTGLVWEVKATDGGLRDKNNTYTWFNSDVTTNGGGEGSLSGGNCPDTEGCHTERFVTLLNEIQLCGIASWRMPTVEEARSIVNYGPDYFIDTQYFPNTQPNKYWTATPYVWSQNDAWLISFSGGLSHPYLKSDNRPVRVVSSK